MNCIDAQCIHCKLGKSTNPNAQIFKSMLYVYCELGHPCRNRFNDEHPNIDDLHCWDYKRRSKDENH